MRSNKVGLQDFLYRNLKKGNWEGVIKKCEEDADGLLVKLTQSWDTVLHLAAYGNKEEVVGRLVQLICKSGKEEILKVTNERKNTPLHVAAAVGCVKMCHVIGSVNHRLVDERNNDGETPLFLAALHGHTTVFYCLYEFCKMDSVRVRANCRRTINGDTILHFAIKNKKFDLAFQLLNMIKEAAIWVDAKGYTPLHILASKPSFFRSGARITGWQYIIYQCICVEELKPKSEATSRRQVKKSIKPSKATSLFPENYTTCIDFFTNLWNGFLMLSTLKRLVKKKKEEEDVDPCNYDEAEDTDLEKDVGEEIDGHDLETTPPSTIFPQNYETCINFLQIFFSAILIILGFGFGRIKKLREKKERHKWSVQVMEKLLELAPPGRYGSNGDTPNPKQFSGSVPYILQGKSVVFNPGEISADSPNIPKLPNNDQELNEEEPVIAQETVMLLAAKNGVVEIVSRLFEDFPLAIHDVDVDKKNVVLLAAEYRQPEVYKFLLSKRTQLQTLFRAVDKDGNSALHLAAHFKTHKIWRIKGPALQMQWEVKWYRYVRDSVEPHFFSQYNNKQKLARTFFYDTHKELGEKGGLWFINTSKKSCSILAALLVTVAYTSATTVPGGYGKKGNSPFINEKGFFIFSIASLISLCLSTTSVIMFLAILTSRLDEKDFGSKLPGRLFIALSSLFFSIVAMLVSFCAGHYFLLSYYLQNITLIIYIATSIPVALLFITVQLSLYYDLLFAILCKTPKRNTDVAIIN